MISMICFVLSYKRIAVTSHPTANPRLPSADLLHAGTASIKRDCGRKKDGSGKKTYEGARTTMGDAFRQVLLPNTSYL